MIKFIISLLFIQTSGFSIGNIKKPRLNVIKMSNIPDYDPSKMINSLAKTADQLDKWNLNDFLIEVSHKHIDSVSIIKTADSINSMVIIDNNYDGITPSLSNLHFLETGLPKVNDIIIESLIKNDIYYKILQMGGSNSVNGANPISFLVNALIVYFLITTLLSFIQNKGSGFPGGSMNPMNANRLESKAIIDSSEINTSFKDVAGCDEAKYELEEIVDFLKNPDKYYNAGAKVPKGVLLEGPPGTGKTLLARAVAGEAGVSFIQVSASEFIQMFVGVGASRVRDLFTNAKKNSPCVVFIDEIDAIGRKRGEQFGGGGNEEREQTLNQILTNMDGFEKTDKIVVLAATNRVDILDSALTRSGRFDRKISVNMPDILGRRKILDVHLKNKKVERGTDLDEIAILTSGFSGADIENMANEAIIFALRDNRTIIKSKDLIDAYEKITIGLPLLSKDKNEYADNLVSYHEAGHTITALLFRDFFDVRKVTITANTNGAGGYTLFTPKEKFNSYPTKKYLLANLIVTMGGRAAEIILYNKIYNNFEETNYSNIKLFNTIENLDITTGASGDLKQADNLARRYIELFGYDDGEFTKTIQMPTNPYLSLSENTKSEIDENIIKLINFGLEKAIEIIEANLDTFNKLANDLINKRTVNIKYLNSLDVYYF